MTDRGNCGNFRGRGGRRGGLGGNGGNEVKNESKGDPTDYNPPPVDGETSSPPRHDWQGLAATIRSIDGAQFSAYGRLCGDWHCEVPDFTLSVDGIQGDIHAPPSKFRATVGLPTSKFPKDSLSSPGRRDSLADYISRSAAEILCERGWLHVNKPSGSPKSGMFSFHAPGQAAIQRSSCVVQQDGTVELRFGVFLPATGRMILGDAAFQIFMVKIPRLVERALLYTSHDSGALRYHIESLEDQEYLRSSLKAKGLVAFIADGSLLPRASGGNSPPIDGADVVPFKSPTNLRVMMCRPNFGFISGLGIPKGVTVITGGSFHGKSTFLEAVQQGVYNHVPQDGREMVVTETTAVKIRAENSRRVTGTNIRTFIRDLPNGKKTRSFTSANANRSMSMAASIQEALELGCETLLIDEDSSSINFLVRGERMQKLVQNEPITPLISKVRALFDTKGVSTVIAVGGLSDWLTMADTVIGMDSYIPRDWTALAHEIVRQTPTKCLQDRTYGDIHARTVQLPKVVFNDKGPVARTMSLIAWREVSGPTRSASGAARGIDLSGIDQLVEKGQTDLIARCICKLSTEDYGNKSLSEILADMENSMRQSGLDSFEHHVAHQGELAFVRRFEIGAAISRMEGLRVL